MTPEEIPTGLDEFRAAYAKDDNLWWYFPSRYHQNLFEAAVERIDAQDAEIERLRKHHADLTSRLGFGDGVTEPQADNDTIVDAMERQASEAAEWQESQSWRTDCYLAGHPDDEDCAEHDPTLRLINADAEIERLRAQVEATLAALEQIDCTFWACKGPDEIEDMVTCNVCFQIHNLRAALSGSIR